MPQFDVLRINQTHLAKVLIEKKRNNEVTNEALSDNASIVLFHFWMKYIRKELEHSKVLTSTTVIYTLD